MLMTVWAGVDGSTPSLKNSIHCDMDAWLWCSSLGSETQALIYTLGGSLPRPAHCSASAWRPRLRAIALEVPICSALISLDSTHVTFGLLLGSVPLQVANRVTTMAHGRCPCCQRGGHFPCCLRGTQSMSLAGNCLNCQCQSTSAADRTQPWLISKFDRHPK